MLGFLRWLRSFTLIEMLVVIAIIGLLAGMLLPALARARESGRQAKCKSNQSQIGKAIFMYGDTSSGFFPLYDADDRDDSATDSLALLYPEYIPTERIFRCPSTGDRPNIHNEKQFGTSGIPEYKSIGFGYDDAKPDPKKNRTMRSSYGYDQSIQFGSANVDQPICADMDGSSVTNPTSHTANHKGGQIVLFVDGHVDWTNVNTWDNDGEADNMFTDDISSSDTDTDAWVKDHGSDADTYVRRIPDSFFN